jgi:hypothetical protein
MVALNVNIEVAAKGVAMNDVAIASPQTEDPGANGMEFALPIFQVGVMERVLNGPVGGYQEGGAANATRQGRARLN